LTDLGLLEPAKTVRGTRYRRSDLEGLRCLLGPTGDLKGVLERLRRLSVTSDVAAAIFGQLEPDETVRLVCEKLTEALGCTRTILSTYDHETGSVTTLTDYDAGGQVWNEQSNYKLADYPLTTRVVNEQQPALVNLSDPDPDPAELAVVCENDDRSLLILPLVYRGKTLGIAELLDNRRERHYSKAELALASSIADQAAVALHNALSFDRAQRRSRELEGLTRIATAVTASSEVGDVLGVIADTQLATLEVYWCGLYSYDEAHDLLRLEAHRCADQGDLAEWQPTHSPANHPAIARALRQKVPVAVYADDPKLDEQSRQDLRRAGDRSQLFVPMLYRDNVIGLLFLGEVRTARHFSAQDLRLAMAIAAQGAAALETARSQARERQESEKVKALHLANLRALSTALSAKDYYTLGHAGRVAAYMVMLGAELGWPLERLEEVREVAFLHDIGKIGVSERVLLKGGPLTSEEWELVRQHPGISAEIVRPLFDAELVSGVRHHHERYDGKGYPDGLAGAEIPLLARAMCVVDCYDAMSSDRPYRCGLSYRQCLAELRRCAGAQFDPEMVEAFLPALRRLRARGAYVAQLAAQAAALIDPIAHARLRQASDEQRPEYQTMVAALKKLRDANPRVRFITSFTTVADGYITVLDTGDSADELSHVGDPWLPHDELARVLAGQALAKGNVLNADEFGVWVTGVAPLCDRQGVVSGAVTVDVPAIEWAPPERKNQSSTLAATLRSAAMRFSRAEVEAISDGLTGLYNHRYLHERLDEELRRAEHREAPLSLLFCDCDQFKVYNDTYGHKVGDQVLVRIARVLGKASRRVDLASRYGGEEFVVVLVGTDTAGALKVADRIRAEVQRTCTGEKRPLTISIGVASYPQDATAKDELLDKADWAMYAAKRAGRNRALAFCDGLVAKETWLSRRGR
jgi:diguanylate cyclase (GGDEF)-like protein